MFGFCCYFCRITVVQYLETTAPLCLILYKSAMRKWSLPQAAYSLQISSTLAACLGIPETALVWLTAASRMKHCSLQPMLAAFVHTIPACVEVHIIVSVTVTQCSQIKTSASVSTPVAIASEKYAKSVHFFGMKESRTIVLDTKGVHFNRLQNGSIYVYCNMINFCFSQDVRNRYSFIIQMKLSAHKLGGRKLGQPLPLVKTSHCQRSLNRNN